MDFFERVFLVSPDGGDGATEMLYVAVAIAVCIALAIAAHLRARARNGRGGRSW